MLLGFTENAFGGNDIDLFSFCMHHWHPPEMV